MAGELRGRRIEAPPGSDTRPTTDKVREAVFNALVSRDLVRDARVADLFAGTGALGIEALSRGADHCTFVERDRNVVRTLLANDLISRATTQAFFDEQRRRFLPDRYIEGTCPYCGNPRARGDQCDNCGRTLDPTDLIDPRSKLSGTTPVPRQTEHYFLELPKLEARLLAYVEAQEHWRQNVRPTRANSSRM